MANITVPGATRQTPQAVETPRLPQDQSFARLAAAADGVAHNWSQRELQDRADALRRARTDAADQLAQIGQEFEQDTDFGTMEQRYGRSVEALETMIGENLPQAVREEFSLSFRDMARPQVAAVGRRAFSLRGDQARAELGAALEKYQNLAAGMDDDASREGIYSMVAADHAAAVSAGYITAEAAQEQTAKFAQGVDLTRASRRLREDPENFDPATFGHLSPMQRESLAGQRENELDRRRARAEAEENKIKLSAEQALAAFNEGALVGLDLTSERRAELMAAVAPAGAAYVRRAEAAIQRSGLYQRLALMSPSERAAELEGWRRSGGASADDVDWFGKLQTLDGKLTDAEGRAHEAALKERRSFLKERIGLWYDVEEAGGVFPFRDQLATAVAGDPELEAEFNEVAAMASAFALQRGAEGSFTDQTAQLASVSAMPVTTRRRFQFRTDFRANAEKALNALGTELRGEVAAQIDALTKGVRRGDFDATMEKVWRQDPDLARELSGYEALWAQTRYNEGATAAEIFPRTEAGGAPPPKSDAAVLGILRATTQHEALQEQERKDPLTTLAAQQSLSPLDLTDPHTIATRALDARAFFSTRLGTDAFGNSREPVLTTMAERADWKGRIAVMPTPQQVEVWRNAAHAAGPYGPTLLREIEAPEAIIWGAAAEQAGAPAGMLAEISRGYSALRGPPANAPKAPSAEDQRKWTYEAIGGEIFARSPSELGRALEATTAIYAARAGLKQEPDEDIWKASLQAALGANGERGGVREVAGRLTALPSNFSAREAEAVLNGLISRHVEAEGSGRREIRHPETGRIVESAMDLQGLEPVITQIPPQSMASVWGGITSNGAPPLIFGQPVDGSVLNDISLKSVSGGLYALEYERRGEFYRLEDPTTGAPLTIRLEDLARRP